jgi:hypothetical protein
VVRAFAPWEYDLRVERATGRRIGFRGSVGGDVPADLVAFPAPLPTRFRVVADLGETVAFWPDGGSPGAWWLVSRDQRAPPGRCRWGHRVPQPPGTWSCWIPLTAATATAECTRHGPGPESSSVRAGSVWHRSRGDPGGHQRSAPVERIPGHRPETVKTSCIGGGRRRVRIPPDGCRRPMALANKAGTAGVGPHPSGGLGAQAVRPDECRPRRPCIGVLEAAGTGVCGGHSRSLGEDR